MANPRQRHKAKSSTHRAVSHSKRAKRLLKKTPAIRGPRALQDAWDPSKTLRQNYLALGLQHDLNPIASGGCEAPSNHTADRSSTSQASPTASSSAHPIGSEGPAMGRELPRGFGRIIRDSAGNVVRVELPRDEGDEPEREPMVDVPAVPAESELRTWADRGETSRRTELGNGVVQGLEQLAASASVRERHTSTGERSYLERLVKKHGDDLVKMARDRRLNPAQRTANELQRAIAKTGGLEALRKGTDVELAG